MHPPPFCQAYNLGLAGANKKNKAQLPKKKVYEKIYADTNKKGGWPNILPVLANEEVKATIEALTVTQHAALHALITTNSGEAQTVCHGDCHQW